jgi:pimeloyl-ACP methyl ester carboxylesterase
VHVPVLLVRGAESDVVSAEIAHEFLAAVPQAELVEVAGARHMVSGDENDAFANAILAFLESLRDEPAQAAS